MSTRSAREHAASANNLAAIAASHLARYRALIQDWDAFAAALCRPLPGSLWANPTRITAPALAALLSEEGLDTAPVAGLSNALMVPPGVRTGQHWWYCVGLAHAQELVSQIPVTLMDLSPGQRVLDMCAAPGGKTAQIAFALDNRGTLVANDVSFMRLKALQGNLDRLGVVNVTTTCSDAANWPSASGQFDRILVDAPCSSEGTIRRNPSLLQRLELASSERLAPRQRALLRKAVQRCRPGGRILYSTCTFAPEENELVVADILGEFEGMLRLAEVTVPGVRTRPGLTAWGDRRLPPELARCLRFWPQDNDSGGFFIAVLDKRADLAPDPEPKLARPSLDGHADWLEGLASKYGLEPGYWAPYRVHRQTRRGLHLMAADHAPPAVPKAESSGLFFHRTNVRPPKPTTAGALLMGRDAARFHLELTREQRDAYLRRETFAPTAQQMATASGQIMVAYQGHLLGVAILHRSGVIESQFPSRWSGCTGGPAQTLEPQDALSDGLD